MVRKTSKEAYAAILSSGLLSQRQKQAYAVLWHFGPMTAKEMSQKMGLQEQWKLCAPMKEAGIITEAGERPCSLTGNNCITWDVTNRVPVKPPARVSNKERTEIARKILGDIYWRVKHNVQIDLQTLEDESKRLLHILETGHEPS